MSKLTLSVDEIVIARAKELARRHRTSVSRLVERYLDHLTRPSEPRAVPPVLGRLRGVAAGADEETYRRHLRRKYE